MVLYSYYRLGRCIHEVKTIESKSNGGKLLKFQYTPNMMYHLVVTYTSQNNLEK